VTGGMRGTEWTLTWALASGCVVAAFAALVVHHRVVGVLFLFAALVLFFRAARRYLKDEED
jgi:hypothetical protein